MSIGRVNGKQIVDDTVIKTINGLTFSDQYMISNNDTNVRLTIATSGSTHSFTLGWTGSLPLNRGGLSNSTFTASQILIVNSATSAVISSGYKFNDGGTSSNDIWSAGQILNRSSLPSNQIAFGTGTGITSSNSFTFTNNVLNVSSPSPTDTEIKMSTNNGTVRFDLYIKDSDQTVRQYAVNTDNIFYNGPGSTMVETMRLTYDNNIIASKLAGTGSRMVIADSTGLLSTQAIPSSSTYSFVPYTGATGSLNMGNNNVNAQSFITSGTGGNGFTYLNSQSVTPTAPTAIGVNLFSNSSGNFAWNRKPSLGNDTFVRGFSGTITADRFYILPDKAGTVALTSDLTSYTAQTPVILTGTTFSIQQSSSTQSGYLSSTDWSTFNNKQNDLGYVPYNSTNPAGYITASALNSYLTQSNVYTAQTPVILTGNTFSIQQSSSTQSGFVSSADWNTFNNKITATALSSYLTIASASAGYQPLDSDLTSISGLTGSGLLRSGTGTWSIDTNKYIYNFYKDVVDSATISGTTSEVLVKSLFIPANTFTVGDLIYVRSIGIKTGTAGNQTIRVRTNTVNGLTGSPTLLGSSGGAVIYNSMSRSLIIKNSTTTTQTYQNALATDEATATTARNIVAVNWTVNQYMLISLQNASAADTSLISLFTVEKH